MAESLSARFARRLVTIPSVVIAFWLVLACFPALFVIAVLLDLVRGAKTFSSTRLVVFLLCFLAVENLGLGLLGWTWLTTRADTRARAERTFAIQRLYTAGHLASVRRVFSLRFVVEGGDLVMPGPMLLFVRHSSVIDSLVPGGFIANVHHTELRYVLKRELLVEPCLDVAGHWIPNRFVSRSGEDTAKELLGLRELKAGLAGNQGVLIYPEGTRFSRGKRAAILGKLSGEAKARAERLRHLLPVRKGGALALLEAAPACDVIFVGHHGLEGFARIADIWRGALVGKTVTIRFWREPVSSIPAGEDARLAWMNAHWQRMDDWLEGLG